MTPDQLGIRGVAVCFVAATGISFAAAILLGPKPAGMFVLVLGLVFIAGAAVLDGTYWTRLARSTSTGK